MSQIWVTLVDGSYGYMWGDALPLPGDTVTIRVRHTTALILKSQALFLVLRGND